MSKFTLGTALVAILIATLAYFHTGVGKAVTALGTAVSCAGNTTCIVGDLNLSGAFAFGGVDPSSDLQQQVSLGTCNTGAYAASSTQFAVQNPFNATSTVAVETLYGTGQATTTSFSIGTSTRATGIASTIGKTLASAAKVATSTQFYLISGQTTLLGSGQISSGTTVSKIVVGPTQYVAMYATSTATGAGSKRYTAGLTCTYKLRWQR